ncbi:MAG: ATP-binding protein [Saonia sp.]
MIKNQTTKTNSTHWLKQVPSSIALLDHNYCLIDASTSWFEKFNFTENSKGENFFTLFPRFTEDWKVKLDYVMDGLNDIQIMDKVLVNNDSPKRLLWHLNPWKDGYGKLIGVIVNVQDMTEAKELEIELQRTKQVLDQKSEIAKIGSWEYDLEKDQVTWSPIIRKIYGVSKDYDASLESAMSFYKIGNSRDTIQEVVAMAIETGKPWDENLKLITKNNGEIWVNTIGRPKFKDGKCSRIIGTLQDITHKMTDKHFMTEVNVKNDYEQFFHLSPTAMAVNDYKTGRFVNVNGALLDLLGRRKEELLDRSFLKFLNFKKLGKTNPLIQLAGAHCYGPLEVDFVDGEYKKLILQLKGQVIYNDKNEKIILTVIQDVTKERAQQKMLKGKIGESNTEIQKLVNFAHMVSHNLKGQATNFSLLLNFLAKENREKERKSVLSMLFQSTDSLTDTIKGLREVVAIRQNINLKKKSLVLNEYIYKAEQGLAGLIKKEQVKIVNEIPDNLKVMALPIYLENILGNLFSNAIKFRKEERDPVIVLSVDVQKYHTILNVEDNGIGIDLDKHGDRLFGLYKTLSEKGDSRGMGLYLAKYQVELMKGKIECESTLGEGTTFRIYFSNR